MKFGSYLLLASFYVILYVMLSSDRFLEVCHLQDFCYLSRGQDLDILIKTADWEIKIDVMPLYKPLSSRRNSRWCSKEKLWYVSLLKLQNIVCSGMNSFVFKHHTSTVNIILILEIWHTSESFMDCRNDVTNRYLGVQTDFGWVYNVLFKKKLNRKSCRLA